MGLLQAVIADDSAATGFVYGLGPSMLALNAMAAEIARTDIPVLISGESGTGKDTYARLMHSLSDYCGTLLKKINCSVLDPAHLLGQLQEGLEGHSEVPQAGTLFLDGIDELDLASQRALLSFLPDGEVQQNLATRRPRLISSSSRDLAQDVKAGRFRKELYFRINGVCLRLLPLRERKSDVTAFLEHFLKKYAQDLGRKIPPIDQETVDTLMTYDWPGNIRELENLARKTVALGNMNLAMEDLRIDGKDRISVASPEQGSPLKLAVKAASRQRERELILQALERTKWNRKRAARELQISYKALLYKLKRIETLGDGYKELRGG